MRKFIVALAMASLALAQAAHAEDAPEPPIGMVTPGGPHFECGKGWATPITYRDLMANIDKWIGRCVRVRGLTRSYYYLHADLPDYYRKYDMTLTIEERTGPGLGMYAKRALEKRLFRNRQEVEVVAMAYTCERYWEWAKKEVVRKDGDDLRRKSGDPKTERLTWLSGYCHYTGDPVLFVSEARVINRGPLRFEGAAAAAKYGDLELLPANHPDYAEIQSRLTSWFDALRGRDGAALLKQSGDATPEDLNDKRGKLYKLLNAPDSGARFLFSRKHLPPMRLMRARLPEGHSNEVYAFGCLCKRESCEDRWPIHSADASIDDAWPYACAWIHRADGEYLVFD
jgi:hypothetical protein